MPVKHEKQDETDAVQSAKNGVGRLDLAVVGQHVTVHLPNLIEDRPGTRIGQRVHVIICISHVDKQDKMADTSCIQLSSSGQIDDGESLALLPRFSVPTMLQLRNVKTIQRDDAFKFSSQIGRKTLDELGEKVVGHSAEGNVFDAHVIQQLDESFQSILVIVIEFVLINGRQHLF